MRAFLINIFELYLIFAPNAYYQPALETNDLAVIIFSVLVNIAAVKAVYYITDTIKETFRAKPIR